MANVATHLHLVDAHEKSGRENNLELRVQYTLLGNFFLEGPTKEMVMYFLSQYQTIRNSTLEDWFLSKYCHSRKMIIKTWFQSNLTLEENPWISGLISEKKFLGNRQEIDFEDMKNLQKIDFLTPSLLQYKTWSFKKNDSKNVVSIQPDFEEKILDFGLDLRKKVFGKSTGNRFRN